MHVEPTDLSATADWRDGVEVLLYERCGACGHREYFRRGFCPRCGSRELQVLRSEGKGSVYAATVVVRAPSPEWREFAPYALLLVDLDEGFRVMVQGADGLAIDQRIVIGWARRGASLLPFATPDTLSGAPEKPPAADA
jgi:uncharacterized OB-fold protein